PDLIGTGIVEGEKAPALEADSFARRVAGFFASRLEELVTPRRAPQRGTLVVLAGLDGSGKTTVAREICAQAARSERFQRVRYFHWRPAVFGSADLPLPEFRNVPRKPKSRG